MDASLIQLSDEWDASLEAAGRAAKTRKNYRAAIASFIDWCEVSGHPPVVGAMQRRTIEAWVRWMRTRGLGPRTVLLRWKSLAVFAGWLVDEQIATSTPFYRLSAPAVPPDFKAVLSVAQIEAIIDACHGSDFISRRDELMLRVLRDTGCRAGELVGMKVGDFDPTTRSAVITKSKTRPRQLAVSAATVSSFHRYMRSRARLSKRDHPALFLSNRGALTYNGFLEAFGKRTALAGVRTHPHAFRHHAADQMLRSAMGVDAVARVLGHTSLAMVVSVYGASLADDRALEAQQKFLADRG